MNKEALKNFLGFVSDVDLTLRFLSYSGREARPEFDAKASETYSEMDGALNGHRSGLTGRRGCTWLCKEVENPSAMWPAEQMRFIDRGGVAGALERLLRLDVEAGD